MTKIMMIMGTGSDVGKSLMVAGLCRAYKNRGLKVAPFKPQNMSNNAAVTADHGEIGRAQALQARAAGLAPITAMNPVLLKPEHNTGAQVVVRGKRVASMSASDYFSARAKFMPDVLAAFDTLATDVDLIIIEGAGSASEVNLRHNDLANFGFARAVDAPVILVGDIERGGVIASIVGTLAVIDPSDANLVVASMINKFRGDPALFADGGDFIAAKTERPCLGPIPYFADARKLPAEDVLALDQPVENKKAGFDIVVPRLARIANFDDLDPLRAEKGVNVQIIDPGLPLPRDADLIIIPGSKATRADMNFITQQGWDVDIKAHVRAGGAVLGICGGYQMLGNTLADPQGIEGEQGTTAGLGLLAVDTTLETQKQLRLEQAVDNRHGAKLSGYHMHMGVTTGDDCNRPFANVGGTPEGATSVNGLIMGTYLHGLFAADTFRQVFLKSLGAKTRKGFNYEQSIETTLNDLAAHLERHLDLGAVLDLAKPYNPGAAQ